MKEEDFNQNMHQLVCLLKKILKNLPLQDSMPQLPSLLKESGINVNLCFFTFLPISPEDLDDLEDLYDPLWHEERAEDSGRELSADDREFLRRNGIRF